MENRSAKSHTNEEGSTRNLNKKEESHIPTILVEHHKFEHDLSEDEASEPDENDSMDPKLDASQKFHKTRRRSNSFGGSLESGSSVAPLSVEKNSLDINPYIPRSHKRRRSSTFSGSSLNFKVGSSAENDSLDPQLDIDYIKQVGGTPLRVGTYLRAKEYSKAIQRKSSKLPPSLKRSTSVGPAPEGKDSLDINPRFNNTRRRSSTFSGSLNFRVGSSADNDSLDPRLDIDNVTQVGGATLRPATYYRAKEYARTIQRKSIKLPTSIKLFRFHIRDEVKKLIQQGMTLEEIAKENPGWIDIINEYWKASLERKAKQLSDIDSASDFDEDYDTYKEKTAEVPGSNSRNYIDEKPAEKDFTLYSTKRKAGINAIKLSDEQEGEVQVTRWRHSTKNIRVENKWSIKPTLYERMVAATLVEKKASLSDKSNKKQAKNASKLLLKLSSVPLSKFWQKCTEIFAMLVFITGLCVAVADIWISPVYLYYKITALVLGLLETFVLFGMWVITKLPKFKNHPDPKTLAKKQQYVENITHELLLLVLLIITVIGFSTEKMYTEPSHVFGWIQLILLLIDIADITWTQFVRVYMMFKFVSDIQKVLEDEEDRETAIKVEVVETIEGQTNKNKSGNSKSVVNGHKKKVKVSKKLKIEKHKKKLPLVLKRCWLSLKKRNWSFAGGLLARAFFSAIGNMIIFLYLLFMFGVQTHHDNYESSDYHLTLYSGIQIACLCIFPFFSLILFVLVNLYWVMEILISVNCYIGKNQAFQETLSENYGAIISDSLGFAAKNYENSQLSLEKIKSLSLRQKLTYGLSDMKIAFMIVLWQIGVLGIASTFDGFDNSIDNIIVSGVFIGLCILFNAHTFLLMIIIDVLSPFVLLGLLFYPFTITVLYKPRYKLTQTVIEEEEETIITDLE